MPDAFSTFPPPALSQTLQGATLDELHAHILSLDPALDPSTERYHAALVLLAAQRLGQNVDRIARFTGVPRETVARYARRLVDNGVWRDGNTVSDWDDSVAGAKNFWADVQVAEGKLCRRGQMDGSHEWAPPGYWRKHYEYVGPRGEEQPQATCYHPHVEPLASDLPYWLEGDEDEEDAQPVARQEAPRPVSQSVPEDAEEESRPVWLGAETTAEPEYPEWPETPAATAGELFPEAVWLS